MDKNYDLKIEMLKFPQAVKRMNDVLMRIKKDYDKPLNDIFNVHENEKDIDYIERYLLFKIQSKLGCTFDCDKLSMVKKFYDFDVIDTVFSLQTIWGKVLGTINKNQKYFCEDSEEYQYLKEEYGGTRENDKIKPRVDAAQPFIYQLSNIEEIKEILRRYKNKNNNNLYDKFNEFAHFYHTIGNMAPCPKHRYNNLKGSYDVTKKESKFNDRIDLFLECLRSDNWEYASKNEEKRDNILKWFYKDETYTAFSDNVIKYKIDLFINCNLPDKIPVPKDENDIENIGKLIDYLDEMINIIKKRANMFEKIGD